jgi:hypothetical protein
MIENASLRELPVLIIGYARGPQIMEIIERCISAGIERIYLHLDGPRDTEVERIQAKVKENLLKLDSKVNINVLQQRRNLGVALGVIKALNWFFSEESRGFILEDDLVVSDESFYFIDCALKYIEDNKKALMVSASSFQKTTIQNTLRSRWTNVPLIWGWGTTREKWRILYSFYSLKINWWEILTLNPIKSYFLSGSLRALSKKVDTWDTPLAYQMIKCQYLCLVSPRNLVINIGVDNYASHTKSNSFPLNNPIEKLELRNVEFKSPSEIAVRNFNQQLKREVFGIKLRHLFSPLRQLSPLFHQYELMNEVRRGIDV